MYKCCTFERASKDGKQSRQQRFSYGRYKELLSLKKQIALAGGKPLAFIAVAEETDEAYAAVAVQAAGKSNDC